MVEPAWVYKRNGQLVPFEPDKISRSLFAASEQLGSPSAFLARELTDGVVHFLEVESDATIPNTAMIADLVVKVVRELGQPALAKAYANYSQAKQNEPDKTEVAKNALLGLGASIGPSITDLKNWVERCEISKELSVRAGKECLRQYSLQEIYARDIAAAHVEGLLAITGLEAPLEIASSVIEDRRLAQGALFEALEQSRRLVGAGLVIDGPEHGAFARSGHDASKFKGSFADFIVALQVWNLPTVINLNCASPPAWAGDLAEGPLFGSKFPEQVKSIAASADDILDQGVMADTSSSQIRIHWHLASDDFSRSSRHRLMHVAARAVQQSHFTFVFDRPRRVISLGAGLDRKHPACLLAVGVDLPQLAKTANAGQGPEIFLRKLGSLARLALSAGVQKRNFLRRHSQNWPKLTRGFLLDRARLVVIPVGLEELVRQITGKKICEEPAALDLACQIIRRLADVLQADGKNNHLEAVLDSTEGFFLGVAGKLPEIWGPEHYLSRVAGVTCWDESASYNYQLKAAGALHQIAGAGTAAVVLPANTKPSAEDLVEILCLAWDQGDVVKLQVVRSPQIPQQLVAHWEA